MKKRLNAERPPPLTPEQEAILLGSADEIKCLAIHLAGSDRYLWEDIQSIIRIHCVRAVRVFEPERKCKLIALAWTSAVWEARRFRDADRRHGVKVPHALRKSTPLALTHSMDVCPDRSEPDSRMPDPADLAEIAERESTKKKRLRQFWKLIRQAVSPTQYHVLRLLYRDGMSHRAAGQLLDKSCGYTQTVVKAAAKELQYLSNELNKLA